MAGVIELVGSVREWAHSRIGNKNKYPWRAPILEK
jgi:hypothetical protein